MKQKTRSRILFLFIFCGLSVLNYPFVSQTFNLRMQGEEVRAYEADMEQVSEDDRIAMREEAEAYNRELSEAAGTAVRDAFGVAGEMSERYEGLLNADGSGIMGYLSIPEIHVSLPVYHGTSVRVLEAGAGHLEGTSLPVGGAGTHAVISAHNGLPSKLLFTDLDQLQEGNLFFLTVLGEEMAYEVDQILVVEPQDTDALQIEEGKDYVTLVTCTPYGVNSHRYLVRGHRIDWDGEEESGSVVWKAGSAGKWDAGRQVLILSLMVLMITAAILFIPGGKGKRK